jgi:hypothetical protein
MEKGFKRLDLPRSPTRDREEKSAHYKPKALSPNPSSHFKNNSHFPNILVINLVQHLLRTYSIQIWGVCVCVNKQKHDLMTNKKKAIN